MKRIVTLTLAVLCIFSMVLSGCNNIPKNYFYQVSDGNLSLGDALKLIDEIAPETDLDKQTLLTIDGVDFSAAAVKYANVFILDYFSQIQAEGEEFEKMMQEEINNFYTLNAGVIKLCVENKIAIPETLFEENVTSQIEYAKETYGEDMVDFFDEYLMMTPRFFCENMLINIAFACLQDYYYGENGIAEDKDIVAANVLADLEEKDYIRAKHILVAFPEDIEKDENGNVVEGAKAETLAKANLVLDKVNAGEDFDALIEKYGEDPGTASNPDGYVFTKGQMVEPFEKAAYALEEGKTSGLVETPFGYHIIKRLPMDEKSVLNTEDYSYAIGDSVREIVTNAVKDSAVDYKKNYDSSVEKFVSDYKAKLEEQAQIQQNAQTQSGTNAQG